MFDQSLLSARRTNKAWTLAVSVVVQLTSVAILCLIPLIYTDQLQGVGKWVERILPPSVQQRAPEPVTQQVLSRAVSNDGVMRVPLFIPKGVAVVKDPQPAGTLDVPSGPVIVGAMPGNGSSDVGMLLTQLAPPPRPPAPPLPAPPEPNARPSGPIRVSQGVQEAKLLRKIVPLYPPIAIAARVQGTVRLVGVISRDGAVKDLQVLDGNPLLVRAAIDAVRQWIYQPTLLNGEPVEVVSPITVSFLLNR